MGITIFNMYYSNILCKVRERSEQLRVTILNCVTEDLEGNEHAMEKGRFQHPGSVLLPLTSAVSVVDL